MRENLFFSKILTKSESVRFGTVSSPRPLQQFNWLEPGALWKRMVIAIFSTWGDISESVCGDLGKTGEWWEGCPCSDSSSGVPVEKIPLRDVDHQHCCFERLPLASWGCRTCSSRPASWPAGFRGAPADCSPASHLSSPRPTWSAQHNITKVNPTVTHYPQPPNSKR